MSDGTNGTPNEPKFYSGHPDEDGVHQRAGNMRRSEMARIKDVVLIARHETAQGTKVSLDAMQEIVTTMTHQFHEVSKRLDALNKELEITHDLLVTLTDRFNALEARTLRGRWRRFITWLKPQRITEEQYVAAVLPTIGVGPQEPVEADTVSVPHIAQGKLVGHFRRFEGTPTFIPNDEFDKVFGTGAEAHQHQRSLHEAASKVLGMEVTPRMILDKPLSDHSIAEAMQIAAITKEGGQPQ